MSDADLIEKFKKADKSKFPDFEKYDKPLEMGLWVLWVAKEELKERKLSAEQISSIILDEPQEVTCDSLSITRAFCRAKGKVHPHKENGQILYEIMKAGKKHLMSLVGKGAMTVFRFEPGTRYSSNRELSKNVLTMLTGDLKIVDPYCDRSALDFLADLVNRKIKFLTRLDSYQNDKIKERVKRELESFKSEFSHVEVRDYPNPELHDRYIISTDSVVLLGHGLKDIGSKESFAVILNQSTSQNVVQELVSAFNRRWKEATPI